MRDSIAAERFPFIRITAAVVLIISELAIAGWFTTGRASQDSEKPGAQQGPEKTGNRKETGRKPKEEEEETTKLPRKVPLRVGDEDVEANQPPSAAKSGTVPPADLEREAKRARHSAVQELFSRLAKPHDVVTTTPGLRTWNVEPIPEYIGPRTRIPPVLTLELFDTAWKHVRSFTVHDNEILGVEPYEQLALNKVDEFLKSGLEGDPNSKQYLPRLEMLQEAEKALGAVLLFHDSAVERGLRKGNAWNELRARLVARLQKVQLDELGALTDLKNWENALELAIRLSEAYPSQKDLQDQIVGLLARSARESLKEQDYAQTLRRLHVLEAQFPNSGALDPIRTGLHKKAAELMREAEALEKQGDTKGAIVRLQKVKDIYPQLPGLQDFYLRLRKMNPVLYIGVRHLPEYLSPTTASFDSEKQGVELLFESLVKLGYSAKMGPYYRPGLAGELPKMVPLGRQFTLTHGASWSSDGSLVTATDVRQTIELLSHWRGHILEWSDLLKDGARIGGDNFHISLTLHQGYVDPLSLMDFKVLPGFLNQADDLNFAKAPVGSGPYQLQPRKEPGSVEFVANPYYERRSGKDGLPRIREIHFVRSENPVNDFQEGRLQLLLDLPTSRYKELDSAGLGGRVTLKTLLNRRIYFLAVNHRRPPLENKELRQAIALAINREDILTKYFRAGVTSRPHRALNGPYPPRSWACDPTLPSDPYKPSLAKAHAEKAKEGHAVLRKLSLKYPKGDPAVTQACEEIRKQVQQLGAGIELELQPLESRDLRRDVEEQQDYDLAYYSWDYPNETYWLWPLFDPRATKQGGRNFLGYQDDGALQGAILQAMSYRDPARIKSLTHHIHEIFYAKMPFIPLWQLDTHLAIHKSLSMVDGQDRPVEPDPLLIFTDVETWKLDKH